jgi:hypothetical protein
MAAYKYIGDPAEAKPDVPDEFEAFGLVFKKGEYTDTDELPPKQRKLVEEKLEGNSHFAGRGPGRPKSDPVAT